MDTFVESLLLANSPLVIVRPHASQNQFCAEAIGISQQYFSSLRHFRFNTQQIYACTKMHKVILSKFNQVYRRCLTAVFLIIEADENKGLHSEIVRNCLMQNKLLALAHPGKMSCPPRYPTRIGCNMLIRPV